MEQFFESLIFRLTRWNIALGLSLILLGIVLKLLSRWISERIVKNVDGIEQTCEVSVLPCAEPATGQCGAEDSAGKDGELGSAEDSAEGENAHSELDSTEDELEEMLDEPDIDEGMPRRTALEAEQHKVKIGVEIIALVIVVVGFVFSMIVNI